ncbi:hypothetical protein MNBD_NITROSPIRAE03-1736 [hydrothermal vent metagenome]|uniref:PEP-CTERM protein-sorting domain-containing protein n=1 Tax=hydrothermal vent metagenome TaxID=652676 RepID=A0A3B1DBT3_9ZZZZ
MLYGGTIVAPFLLLNGNNRMRMGLSIRNISKNKGGKMKKISRILMLSTLIILFVAVNAMAVPLLRSGDNNDLQDVLDNITVSGPSSVDVTTDYISDINDSVWTITGSGSSVATMIIELGDYAPNNTFGVYNGTDYVELFDGAVTTGNLAVLSIAANGDVYINGGFTGISFSSTTFGFYLDSSYYSNGGLFHSDTALNDDGVDHMLAYQGNDIDQVQIGIWAPGTWTDNEFVLAFEDLYGGGDMDYDDMVLMVESVQVPEPGSMLLLGSALIGLGLMGRKMRRAGNR